MNRRGNTLYFGRGSSGCIAVTLKPGNYVEIFVGNVKQGERTESATFSRGELYTLSEFFMALWQEHGQEIYVRKIADDPHDSILRHNLDLTAWELP